MHRQPPLWLCEFQSQVSQYLCQPLDAKSGTLTATSPPACLLGQLQKSGLKGRHAESGLLTYNRQHWFRLMHTMQGELPLTAALMGLWSFNRVVQDFIAFAPPQHFNIQKIAADFFIFLASYPKEIQSRLRQALPYQALFQAAQCDQAFQQVFLAAAHKPFVMSPALAANFADLTLIAAESWQIICEDWELLASRLQLFKRRSEFPLKMPSPWQQTKSWLIVRSEQKVGHLALEPLQAKLYELLRLKTVGEALQDLERICPESMREILPRHIQDWMALSMQLELWCELDA